MHILLLSFFFIFFNIIRFWFKNEISLKKIKRKYTHKKIPEYHGNEVSKKQGLIYLDPGSRLINEFKRIKTTERIMYNIKISCMTF